jgi:hypothetical protein
MSTGFLCLGFAAAGLLGPAPSFTEVAAPPPPSAVLSFSFFKRIGWFLPLKPALCTVFRMDRALSSMTLHTDTVLREEASSTHILVTIVIIFFITEYYVIFINFWRFRGSANF